MYEAGLSRDAPMKVLHFVTGGFSGATQVAIELTRAAKAAASMQAVLVLRCKPSTEAARVEALRAEGLHVELVPGWSHAATVWSLARLCRRLRPDVLLAHGFPEHLLGRWAGVAAGAPHLVQVEHNARERYTAWRRAQARWLAPYTDRFVGVSEDVRQILLAAGTPAARTCAVPNGIRLERFARADNIAFEDREPGVVMAARFAKQKDHATLLHALQLLKARGLAPPLRLAGTGGNRHERALRELCTRLGLDGQVSFLGHVADLPGLLMSQRIAVLSSHYEGFGLALAEGMAAGCVSIGTDVPGIRTLIRHGEDGWLVPHQDPEALAEVIERALTEPQQAARMARAARATALARFSRDTMLARYEALMLELAGARRYS